MNDFNKEIDKILEPHLKKEPKFYFKFDSKEVREEESHSGLCSFKAVEVSFWKAEGCLNDNHIADELGITADWLDEEYASMFSSEKDETATKNFLISIGGQEKDIDLSL